MQGKIQFANMINGLIKESQKAIPQNDCDYIGEDGLLYCGKCNTRKQTKIEVFGQMRRPMCLCECAERKLKRKKEEEKRLEYEARVERLRKAGFPKSSMQKWNFANDDLSNEKITKAMQKYVQNFPEFRKIGKGLLLYGSVGTGKTYAACEVANALIDQGYPVLVTNFSRIINTLQETFDKQKYIDSFDKFSLLVLDDLGIERDTQFAKEQIFNVVDARYRNGLPLIITTNLSLEKLKNPEDIENKRIYDRILERCFPVEVAGSNRRRNIIRQEYQDMKNLLGL